MTDFIPIIRHCDLCGKDMSIHSLAEQYPCSIYSDGLTLCGACFCVHTNTEPVDISGYEPHHLVWPDDVATDDDSGHEHLIDASRDIKRLMQWSETEAQPIQLDLFSMEVTR